LSYCKITKLAFADEKPHLIVAVL